MSPSQLREVFHVEHKDLVPNYEIVKLTHQLTNDHTIHKRSINSDNLFSNNNKFDSISARSDSSNKSKVMSKNNHHVKKDLSKVAFEKKLVSTAEQLESVDAPQTFHNYDLKNVQQHNVSFSAFGEQLNLVLKPAQGLFRNGPNHLPMWNVRSDANSSQGLFYEPVENVSISPRFHTDIHFMINFIREIYIKIIL